MRTEARTTCGSPGESGDRIATWIVAALLIGTTLLQKFAVPFGGDQQVFVPMLVMLGGAAVGFLSGRLAVNMMRMALYLLFVGTIVLTQFLGPGVLSFSSLFLLFVMHAPYVLQLRPGLVRPGFELVCFQRLMVFFAVVGFCQYFLQYVIGTPYAFFIDKQFPEFLIRQTMNNLNSLYYGSPYYKSNGFFFIEPSMFCQFLAIAVVVEIARIRSYWRIPLYLAGIAVTFSGTGLILLFLLAPAYLIQKRRFFLLAALVLGLATASVWAPLVGLGLTVDRVGEFSTTGSSAHGRFLSPFKLVHDFILPQWSTTLFGAGAGSMYRTILQSPTSYFASTSTWSKIIFEYGFIGFFAYMVFIGRIFTSAGRSGYLRAALFVEYFFLGEYLLPADVHPLILALLAWPAADVSADGGSGNRGAGPVDTRAGVGERGDRRGVGDPEKG